MAKAKGKQMAEDTEVVVEEDAVEATEEATEDTEVVAPKKAKKAAVVARNLDDLMPSQMTRDEMLQFCKDKGIELPAAASNADIRKLIRIHLDNGKKVGPTM